MAFDDLPMTATLHGRALCDDTWQVSQLEIDTLHSSPDTRPTEPQPSLVGAWARPRRVGITSLMAMLTKRRLVAQRDWGFSACQCAFPPLMMLLAVLLLSGIDFHGYSKPILLTPDAAMPLRYARPVSLLATPNVSAAQPSINNKAYRTGNTCYI